MPALLVDLTALRKYPSFRRLWLGLTVGSIGSQLTVVGVAYQTYLLTHSTAMVGLVSLAALVPTLAGSLIGGALAAVLLARPRGLLGEEAVVSRHARLTLSESRNP